VGSEFPLVRAREAPREGVANQTAHRVLPVVALAVDHGEEWRQVGLQVLAAEQLFYRDLQVRSDLVQGAAGSTPRAG
jgi:hypothetical protein